MLRIVTKLNTLIVISMLTLGCLLSACEKEEVNSKVELWSFGPSPAVHGGQIKFIGANLDQVTAIVLPGDVLVNEFITKRSDLIVIRLPNEALAGKVILKTPQGDIESKTMLGFDVPISITSVSPQLVKPGENLTIRGDFMNWVKEVHFFDGKVVTEFVSQSLNELVVQVPMDAQTGPLVVSDGGREAVTYRFEEDLAVKLPELTSLAPNLLKHGEDLTLTGIDLDLVKEIVFAGAPEGAAVSSFVRQSADELVVTVPDYAKKGSLMLIAHSLVEVATTQELSIILPEVSSLAPNPVDPGADLTLTGSNLDLVKSVSFTGGATVSTFVSQSASQIVLTVPSKALKGKLTLTTHRDFNVQTTQEIQITGDLPPLDPFPYAIYVDGAVNGWADWSWGGPREFQSTEIVRDGQYSMKKTYDGSWDGLRVHSDAGVATGDYTKLEFSIFGGAGSNGLEMNIVINEAWGSPYIFTVVEGEWNTFTINLSDLGSPNPLNDIVFQSRGWAGTVHVDHVGLR